MRLRGMCHGGACDKEKPLAFCAEQAQTCLTGCGGDLVQRADVKTAGSLIHSGRLILRQVQEKVGGAGYASTESFALIAVERGVTPLLSMSRSEHVDEHHDDNLVLTRG